MKRAVLLSGVVVLLSLLPACGRREGAPTLPTTPEPPKPVDVHLRLISSQTGRPVAGARVTARRAEYRFTCVALGEVLAEAVSDADGGVVLRGIPGSSDPGPVRRDVALRIDAGPRFLVREVFLGDTPGSDPGVYPLWELAPEIGATEEVTREINWGGVAKPRRPGGTTRSWPTRPFPFGSFRRGRSRPAPFGSAWRSHPSPRSPLRFAVAGVA
jgi:hypothetical protein